MTGDDRLLARVRAVARDKKAVDEANSCIEQSGVARGAIVCDGALQQMADAVELVAGGLSSPLHAIAFAIADIIGVEITAGLLGGHDLADHGVGLPAQLRQRLR